MVADVLAWNVDDTTSCPLGAVVNHTHHVFALLVWFPLFSRPPSLFLFLPPTVRPSPSSPLVVADQLSNRLAGRGKRQALRSGRGLCFPWETGFVRRVAVRQRMARHFRTGSCPGAEGLLRRSVWGETLDHSELRWSGISSSQGAQKASLTAARRQLSRSAFRLPG